LQQEKKNSADVQRKRLHFTRLQRRIIRVRAIMTASNCSPAVASRRTKYVGDFWAPTLLGAHPFEAQVFSMAVSD
jgi:hypothetical protein